MIRKKIQGLIFAALFGATPAVSAAATAESLVQEARVLLSNKQTGQAYLLLVKQELQYAGNSTYDYWLGVAALAAGQFTMATLAYERVLIVNPDNLNARFDMGLAYLRMGNNERALQEFDRVKQANPQRNIRILLDEAIAQARVDKTRLTLDERLSGSISMKVGYDNNLNFSVSEDQLPYLTGLTKHEDFFAKIDADVAYAKPLSANSQLEFKAFGYSLRPFEQTQLASLDLNGSAAYQYFFDGQRVEAGLTVGESWLDDNEYFTKSGGWLGWRKPVDRNSLLDVSGLFNRIRYEPAALESFDYDQMMLSGRLISRLPGKSVVANGGIVAGIENAINNNSKHGDKHLFGVNFGMQGDVSFASSAFFNIGFTKSQYQKASFSFGTFSTDEREDSRLDLSGGLIWQLDKNNAVIAEVEFNSNSSNQTEYSYERTMMAVSFKSSFGD